VHHAVTVGAKHTSSLERIGTPVKKDMLQRSLNRLVRIEPAMQDYSDGGSLRGSMDDDW
jgi:hypothetical protein